MTKRIAAFLTALLLLLSISALPAAAQEPTPSQQIPGILDPNPDFGKEPTFPTVPDFPTEGETEPTQPEETEPAETSPEETGETEQTQEETHSEEALAEDTQPSEAETTEAQTEEATTAATEMTETTAVTEETLPVPEEESRKCSPFLYLAGGAALLVIAVLAVLLVKEKKRSAGQAHAAGIPLQLEILEGRCKVPKGKLYLQKELLIGSDPSCDIVWKDPSVAPRHCRIFLQADVIYLEDLNDRSSTAIDGMKIYAPNRLRSEDEITIGDVRFKFLF